MKKLLVSAAALMLLVGAQASAAPLSASDVTFRGADADGFHGPVGGNDSLATINGLGLFGGLWEASVKDDGPAETLNGYLGINWTLTAPQNSTSGNWSLTLADPLPADLPVTVDILLVLKGGPSWAGYYFAAETFNMVGGYPGTFDIAFLNNGGQTPGLSHMTAYFKQVANPDPDPDPLPEPASMLLVGLGLLGAGAARRRARQ